MINFFKIRIISKMIKIGSGTNSGSDVAFRRNAPYRAFLYGSN